MRHEYCIYFPSIETNHGTCPPFWQITTDRSHDPDAWEEAERAHRNELDSYYF